MKQAILYSSHKEVGRIDIERIEYIYASIPERLDEDLIKVVTKNGVEHYCDEMEFVNTQYGDL